uniref:spidroin-2-like n=1 Tax=Nyctereutes procyonoides TaxID=34880 RepID=UPI0024446C30|nr:spidroin-2-like [Nyctereutes procyonoides]
MPAAPGTPATGGGASPGGALSPTCPGDRGRPGCCLLPALRPAREGAGGLGPGGCGDGEEGKTASGAPLLGPGRPAGAAGWATPSGLAAVSALSSASALSCPGPQGAAELSEESRQAPPSAPWLVLLHSRTPTILGRLSPEAEGQAGKGRGQQAEPGVLRAGGTGRRDRPPLLWCPKGLQVVPWPQQVAAQLPLAPRAPSVPPLPSTPHPGQYCPLLSSPTVPFRVHAQVPACVGVGVVGGSPGGCDAAPSAAQTATHHTASLKLEARRMGGGGAQRSQGPGPGGCAERWGSPGSQPTSSAAGTWDSGYRRVVGPGPPGRTPRGRRGGPRLVCWTPGRTCTRERELSPARAQTPCSGEALGDLVVKGVGGKSPETDWTADGRRVRPHSPLQAVPTASWDSSLTPPKERVACQTLRTQLQKPPSPSAAEGEARELKTPSPGDLCCGGQAPGWGPVSSRLRGNPRTQPASPGAAAASTRCRFRRTHQLRPRQVPSGLGQRAGVPRGMTGPPSCGWLLSGPPDPPLVGRGSVALDLLVPRSRQWRVLWLLIGPDPDPPLES